MSDDLTNTQIALLCDIGEYEMSKASPDQKRDLESLLERGYVELKGEQPQGPWRLTAKGATFLGERGAGLNEA